MYVDGIGYAVGFLFALFFLPQVVQTWRTKLADDVSLTMLLPTLESTVFHVVYAWQLGLTPFIIMNGIFLTLVAFELLLKVLYDKRDVSIDGAG